MLNDLGKRFLLALALVVMGTFSLLHISSCKKNSYDVTPPYISFDTTSGFIGVDTVLPHGTIFSIAVYAEKAGVDQLITSGQIYMKVNNGPDTLIQNMTLATQEFVQAYSYFVGPAGSKSTYIFTFGQLDGLVGSDSITITGY